MSPLKNQLIPYIAEKKWFKGYDGRKVIVPNQHKTLAGILQNGEAVVMKWAMIRSKKELKGTGIRYNQVTWVHDETQSEVVGTKEEAEHVKKVQMEAIEWAGRELGFKIALAGSGSIGLNWAETH